MQYLHVEFNELLNSHKHDWQLLSKKCTCKYCDDGSIYHFKFLKIVVAHILSEVGAFCLASLNVYSKTCVPIFMEINLYLNDTGQKISWHVFLRYGV